MEIDLSETLDNGKGQNLIACPNCGQKLFNVVLFEGRAEMVVKCRRCHRFIKIRILP